jgi:NADPH:quinone reductase-like Zn-dependent oxidoreductase
VPTLGADALINYRSQPEWDQEILKRTGGAGVDLVIEVGGAGTLERSFGSLAIGGKVALIGVLTGRSAEINPYALMWREGTLHGIRVGDARQFEQMNRAIEITGIRPVIDRIFSFAEAVAAYHCQASGDFIGKVVITI